MVCKFLVPININKAEEHGIKYYVLQAILVLGNIESDDTWLNDIRI